MPVISTGKDEIEMEKRLGAALMTGQPLISIDNISGELGGDALCQIIERPVVDIRVLGVSKKVRIEARGTYVGLRDRQQLHAGGRPLPPRDHDQPRRGNGAAGIASVQVRPGRTHAGGSRKIHRGCLDHLPRLLRCRATGQGSKLASFEGWSDTVRWLKAIWSQPTQSRSLSLRALKRSTHFLEQSGVRHE
jgi:hypothetical protein